MDSFLVFHVDYNIFIKIKMLKKKLNFKHLAKLLKKHFFKFQTPCKIVEKTPSVFQIQKFFFFGLSLHKQKTNNV
jgi:hypothetical protein